MQKNKYDCWINTIFRQPGGMELERFWMYCKKNIGIPVLIFGTAFMIYIFLGICISYKMIDTNIFFGADNVRVFEDLTCIKGDHYRTKVHPLFLLLAETVTLFFNGIVNYPEMSVILLEAFCGAMSVSLFYSILKRMNTDYLIRSLFTFIYGFSFSILIFSTVPETFIFSSVGLIGFWYFLVLISGGNDSLSNKEFILLVFFGIICFGFTLTNYTFYIVGMIYLLLCRYEKKEAVKLFFKINIINVIIIIVLCGFQRFIWTDCPFFWTSIIEGICGHGYEETQYMDWSFTFSKTVTWIKQIAFAPLLSSDVYLRNPKENYHPILFSDYALPVKLLLVSFYLLSVGCIFFALIKRLKKFDLKKDGYMIAFLVSYVGNLVLHYFYGYNECFMYSPHYLFYFLIIFGISLESIVNKKVKKNITLGLLLFCVVEFINNLSYFFKTAHLALSTVNSSILLTYATKGAALCGNILLFVSIWWIYRNWKEEVQLISDQNMEKHIQWLCKGIKIYGAIVIITGLFIAFNF